MDAGGCGEISPVDAVHVGTLKKSILLGMDRPAVAKLSPGSGAGPGAWMAFIAVREPIRNPIESSRQDMVSIVDKDTAYFSADASRLLSYYIG